MLAVGIATVWTTCGVRKAPRHTVTAVPGTERAYPTGEALMVSPGERWIAFFEGTISERKRDVTFASVDRKSGQYMRHDLDGLPTDFVPRGLQPNPFELFPLRPRLFGWHEGSLDLGFGEGTGALLFDIGQASAQPAVLPREPLRTSDGVAGRDVVDEIRKLARRRRVMLFQDEWYSLAWRDGRFDDTLYWFDRLSRRIYFSEWDAKSRLVMKIRDTLFKEVHVGAIRVSPDERFLAVKTALNLKSAIPTPYSRTALTVVELDGGKKVEIARYRYIANPVWSADSRRLYFVGGGDLDTVAVRIADGARAFGGSHFSASRVSRQAPRQASACAVTSDA